jgi:dGTP triphosphohydrolase
MDQLLAQQDINKDKVEVVIDTVLSSKKLHNAIKCAIAEKLTDWLKQPLLIQNVKNAMNEISDAHHKNICSAIVEASQRFSSEVKSMVNQNDAKYDQTMETHLQNVVTIADNITSKINTLEDHVKVNLKMVASDINTLDMKQDHNVKHFENVMNLGVSSFHESLSNNAFKINSGHEEIISVTKDGNESVLAEITKIPISITEMKQEVKEMSDAMVSFDQHLTDLKNLLHLIPSLHNTMKDIVELMNMTLGENLLDVPDIGETVANTTTVVESGNPDDTDEGEAEFQDDPEQPKQTTKQRTSKRQANRKKK